MNQKKYRVNCKLRCLRQARESLIVVSIFHPNVCVDIPEAIRILQIPLVPSETQVVSRSRHWTTRFV